MKRWNKILIDRSDKVTKINKTKSFEDFAEELGDYNSNQYYDSKKKFFEFYFKEKYLVWDKYLEKNLNPHKKNLSIASGRGINALSLISKKFDITCSDIKIPHCYESSKKLFGNFDYINLNILENVINQKFDNIYSVSAFYLFSDLELKKIFYNINTILKKDGILILDFGGTEDNLISFFFHDIYLFVEAYIIYYLSKIFNKKIGIKFDYNFGYRFKNHEIINLAKKFGFKFVDLNEYDFFTELQRSILIRKIIEYFPPSKFFFKFFGKKIPYIRMLKFKKI